MGEPEMMTSMEAMYRAGRQEIPHEAEQIQKISRDLYDVIDIVNVESAHAGDPKILVDMLTIGGDLYDVLRAAVVTSLNNCATAVILTADDYRETDDQAASDYKNMDDSLKGSCAPAGQCSARDEGPGGGGRDHHCRWRALRPRAAGGGGGPVHRGPDEDSGRGQAGPSSEWPSSAWS